MKLAFIIAIIFSLSFAQGSNLKKFKKIALESIELQFNDLEDFESQENHLLQQYPQNDNYNKNLSNYYVNDLVFKYSKLNISKNTFFKFSIFAQAPPIS